MILAACAVCAACAISAACGTTRQASIPSSVAGPATSGVTDARLRDLLARHWDSTMREAPISATQRGDHRFDRELPDVSASAFARRRASDRAFLAQARALMGTDLSAADRKTLELFRANLVLDGELDACETETWSVSAQDNVITDWSRLGDVHVVRTRADAEDLLARFSNIPRAIDDTIANLRRGAARGRYASAESLRRTIALVDGELGKPAVESAYVLPAVEPHAGWSRADEDGFAAALVVVVENAIRPAVR